MTLRTDNGPHLLVTPERGPEYFLCGSPRTADGWTRHASAVGCSLCRACLTIGAHIVCESRDVVPEMPEPDGTRSVLVPGCRRVPRCPTADEQGGAL